VAAVGGRVEGKGLAVQLPLRAWADGPVEIQLVQRLPGQARAFFLASGLSPEATDRVARGCVYRTILRSRISGA